MTKTSTALCLVGGFLVTSGVLSRTWVYDQVAVIPTEVDTQVVATTKEPAEFFDLSTLKTVKARLQQTVVIRGDMDASEKASEDLGRDVAVWQIYTCTDRVGVDCLSNPLPMAATDALTALDRHSAVSLSWDDSYLETEGTRTYDPPAGYSSIKFPFGTTTTSYEMWDADLQKSLPMQYAGETQYAGLALYAFDQTLEPTKIGTMEVPGSLVGSDESTVTVDRMYSNHREYTVEPVTGVIIGREESPDSYLALNGRRVLTLVNGTFSLDEDTMRDTAAQYRSLSLQLRLVRTIIPAVAIPCGVLCLALALLLQRRSRRRPGAQATASANVSPDESAGRAVEHDQASAPAR